MKKKYKTLFLVLTSLISLNLFAGSVNEYTKTANTSNRADSILGEWANTGNIIDGDITIEFYKNKDKYSADIVKLKDMSRIDIENPNPTKYKRKLYGTIIIKDLVYTDKKWDRGTLYIPKTGKSYSCEVYLDNSDSLRVRGEIFQSDSISITLSRVK